MTINERAAQLRAAITKYDTEPAPTDKAGRMLAGAKAELIAIDPVILAAEALLEALGTPEPIDPELREQAVKVIEATYVAADGDSNDSEIHVLQEARDTLAHVIHYQHTEES